MELLLSAVRFLSGFILTPILALCLLHSVLNMLMFRRLRAAPFGKISDKEKVLDVSVLVPARNEEHRIRE